MSPPPMLCVTFLALCTQAVRQRLPGPLATVANNSGLLWACRVSWEVALGFLLKNWWDSLLFVLNVWHILDPFHMLANWNQGRCF